MLVSCIAADAKQTSGNRRRNAQNDIMNCMMSLQSTCEPLLRPIGVSNPQQAMQLTVKNVCEAVTAFDRCVTRTLDIACTDNAKEVLLMVAGKQKNAYENALDFICVQQLDEFEKIRECILEKIQTGDIASLYGYIRCQPPNGSTPPPQTAMIPDLCIFEPQMDCVGDVTGDVCGSEAGSAVSQLLSNLVNDLGCSSNDALSKLRRKGLNHVVDLFRRAIKK